jgi:membrane associated rhomboid family serine protease
MAFAQANKGATMNMSRIWGGLTRTLVLPLIFLSVYLWQAHNPMVHRVGALWSDHPHGWQFFTATFLSGNPWHLAINMLACIAVFQLLAPHIRFPFLLVGFLLFAPLANVLYFHFAMPSRSWLVGASGGIYALVGFLAWSDRNSFYSSFFVNRLRLRLWHAAVPTLAVEWALAHFYMPSLAWKLHLLGGLAGFGAAAFIEAVFWLSNQLSSLELKTVFFRRADAFLQKLKKNSTLQPVKAGE